MAAVPGYHHYPELPQTGFWRNNPILVADGIEVEDWELRKMCEPVFAHPGRMATLVKYVYAGQKRAHIQTHLNAHIQEAGVPTDLPRTKEAMRHMIRLEAWVGELKAEGYRVTVGGDFNWAWTKADDRDWTYSPESVFGRLGMVSQFDAPDSVGGTLGRRGIDYVLYDPADLEITGQTLVAGEHSDHSWVLVELQTV